MTLDVQSPVSAVHAGGMDTKGQNRVQVSSDVSDVEWNAYISRHPDATVDHLWQWRDVFTGVFGHECTYLAAHGDQGVLGVLPLVLFRSRIFGRSVISLPFLNYGGVLADDDRVATALVQRAQEVAHTFGAAHVELRHVARRMASLPFRQHKIGLSRRLPATVDDLWKNIDRKVRNQVRKAQKEGLTPVSGGSELVGEFYSVFARNMRDLGTPVYPRRLFDQTLALFPDRTRVFLVQQGGRTLAGGISIQFRDTILVPWASSLREFRHLCPNMLLYWTMLEDAVGRGATMFDFGRSSADGSTVPFKLQWGAESTPLHWEYVMLSGGAIPNQGPSSPRFHTAVQLWKRLPYRFATEVGPLIARHLP